MFQNILLVVGGLVLLSVAVGGIIYMIHLGVQFAVGDLVLAFLITGFPPAVGGAIVRQLSETLGGPAEIVTRVWVATLGLTFVVLSYQIYGFYWASIRPASTRRRVFWQRFGPAITVTLTGAALLVWFGYTEPI